MFLMKNPKISIIIPVHNRKELLDRCLNKIYSQKYKNFETLIIDDASNENLKEVIEKYPIRYFYLRRNSGPGFARNLGVKKSRGNIVVFIDSDVLIRDGALDRIDLAFKKNKDIVAVQGNYTLDTYYKNFFSNFKNITLYHHFKKTKKYSNSIASFCTAILRDVFIDFGGFDGKIKNASIEDEEFGIRLTRKGYKILYDNGLQVKHMKKFNIYSLLKQDFRTAFDKIKSLLRKNHLFDKSELKGSHSSFSLLASIPLSALIALNSFLLLFLQPNLLILTLIVLVEFYLLINIDYFYYIFRVKNPIFCFFAFIFSIVSYLAIQVGIIIGTVTYFLGEEY